MVNLRHVKRLEASVSPDCILTPPPTIDQGPGLQWLDYTQECQEIKIAHSLS